MTVSRICANYLNGFGELSNARNNSINKNMWAVAKVISYIATVGILPLLVKIVQIIVMSFDNFRAIELRMQRCKYLINGNVPPQLHSLYLLED